MQDKPARVCKPSSMYAGGAAANRAVDTENQKSGCKTAWTKTKTHARCRTGDRKRVSVCIVFTDRYQTYCKCRTGFHCLRIQKNVVKSRNKTIKQIAGHAGKLY